MMETERQDDQTDEGTVVPASNSLPVPSVVEPFHFGPAPAPASQDGGSSPLVNNLLLKKKFLQI